MSSPREEAAQKPRASDKSKNGPDTCVFCKGYTIRKAPSFNSEIFLYFSVVKRKETARSKQVMAQRAEIPDSSVILLHDF